MNLLPLGHRPRVWPYGLVSHTAAATHHIDYDPRHMGKFNLMQGPIHVIVNNCLLTRLNNVDIGQDLNIWFWVNKAMEQKRASHNKS